MMLRASLSALQRSGGEYMVSSHGCVDTRSQPSYCARPVPRRLPAGLARPRLQPQPDQYSGRLRVDLGESPRCKTVPKSALHDLSPAGARFSLSASNATAWVVEAG